ncbi:MAG: hypothetical protein D6675_06500 [Gemmatimonadetes bacterium]|nr:MAG: hypothetical protein D6675_06500 [Gemmatimonadota bacterium]
MRQVMLAILSITLFLLIFILLVAFRPFEEQGMKIVISLLVIGTSGVAAGVVFNTSTALEGEDRIPWLLIGLGMMALFFGDIVHTIYDVVIQRDAEGFFAKLIYEIFYFAMYPFFIWAIVTQWRNFGLSRGKWLIAPSIFAVVTLLIFLFWLIIPVLSYDASAFTKMVDRVLAVVYLVLDVVVIAGAAYLIFALWGGAISIAWVLIAAGILVTGFADGLYYHTELYVTNVYPHTITTGMENLADVGYVLTSLLILLGAYTNRLIFEGELA